MPKFSTIKIPGEARERLEAIQAHLAARLSTSVSLAQATVAAIDTLYRLQLDPDFAITSKRTLAEFGRKIADECNARNTAAVCNAIRELTGIEPETEVSADGRFYTIRANGKAVIMDATIVDLAGQGAALN